MKPSTRIHQRLGLHGRLLAGPHQLRLSPRDPRRSLQATIGLGLAHQGRLAPPPNSTLVTWRSHSHSPKDFFAPSAKTPATALRRVTCVATVGCVSISPTTPTTQIPTYLSNTRRAFFARSAKTLASSARMASRARTATRCLPRAMHPCSRW